MLQNLSSAAIMIGALRVKNGVDPDTLISFFITFYHIVGLALFEKEV